MIARHLSSPLVGRRGTIVATLVGCCVWVALCLLLGNVTMAHSEDARMYDIQLPSQSVADALNGLSEQTGAPIVFPSDLVRNCTSNAVFGRYTLLGALEALLKGTGLSGGLADQGVLTIFAAPPADNLGETTVPNNAKLNEQNNVNRSSRAAAWFAALAAAGGVSAQEASTTPTLEEVVVSAQKRGDERLQDVPVPVTVLNADQLAENGQVLLRDYYSSVPGLNILPSIEGGQALSIRGITAGNDPNPVVGIMIDGVPYGAAAGALANTSPPDIDPGDLARLEVLRGPQGTLYGADSMGGLINFVTTQPSVAQYSGRIDGGVSSVHNGSVLGYKFRGSANIPLGDTLAIRVSGFAGRDPGYIDNPVLNLHGVNNSQSKGARIAALWTPSNTVSLKLSGLYQDLRFSGISDVDTVDPYTGLPLYGLQQSYVRGTGGSTRISQAYSAIFHASLGAIELESVTGYNTMHFHDDEDYTYLFGGLSQTFFPPATAAPFFDDELEKKFSEELRLSGTLWKRVDWLIGGFYTHEHDPILVSSQAADYNTGTLVGVNLTLDFPESYNEYAAFGDLTFHFTDQFDVQIGARESRVEQTINTIDSGALFGPTPVVVPTQSSQHNAFTYLLTPRWKISPDLMVYARLASGFRPGGSNCGGATCTGPGAGAPPTFSPDKTYNYELGIKSDFFEHLLSIDGSIYYIDWKKIQISLDTAANFNYQDNGNSAKSEGVELSFQSKPLSGLTIGGWVTYDNAVLTQDFPSNSTVMGNAGNRLPNSARFSGNLSIEDSFPVSGELSGYAGVQVSYVGDRLGVFTGNGQRQTFPSYAKTDVRVGMRYGSWNAKVYVNNLADERGLLNGGVGYFLPFARLYIQPRTVGLNVSRSF